MGEGTAFDILTASGFTFPSCKVVVSLEVAVLVSTEPFQNLWSEVSENTVFSIKKTVCSDTFESLLLPGFAWLPSS